MLIKQTRTSIRRTFTQPKESTIWLAKMNESHFNYTAASKLYREAGLIEEAERCEKLILKVVLTEKTK